MHDKWVLWAAVSSLPQAKKISNEDQLGIGREHCARHGGSIVAELVVPGESRNIVLFEDAARRIAAYAQLKELIDGKAFDVLAYLDRSRLGRKASLSMAVVELCHEAGIIPYEIDNPPANLSSERGYDDDLLGAIKSVGAQQEIRKFVARRASGMIGRVKRGLNPVNLPYGYSVTWRVDGVQRVPEYAIDEPAAAVVRRIFAEYLAGRGSRIIAQRLRDDGLPSPSGGEWQPASVIAALNLVWRYAGFVEINRHYRSKRPYYRGFGAWPPLISEAQANAIVEERRARAGNRRLSDARHLLSGVCICGVCGKAMECQKPYGRNTSRVRCRDHRPFQSMMTATIIEVLRDFIADLANHDLDAYLAAPDDTAAIDTQRQAQQAAIADIAKRKSRADTAYVDGHLDAGDYAAQVQRLRNAEAQATAELARLDTLAAEAAQHSTRRERVDDLVADGLARLDAGDNAWLRQHLRVRILSGQIDILLL